MVVFAFLLTVCLAHYKFLVVIQLDPWSPVRSDFLPFYTSARMLLEGYGEQLYRMDSQILWQTQIGGPELGEVYLNYHPPVESLVFLPLTILPLRVAYWVWNGASLAMVFASIRILSGVLRPVTNLHQGIQIMMALTFIPVLRLLALGQDSALLLMVVALAVREFRQGRDERAGAVLGLGLFRYQLLILPILFLAVRRRWVALRALLVVGLMQVVLSMVLVGWQGVQDYFHLILNAATFDNSHGIFPLAMYNLKAFLLLVGLEGSTWLWPSLALASAVLIASLLIASRGRWDPASPRFALQTTLLILVTMLTSPHLYLHDLAVLIVPGMLLRDATMPGPDNGRAPWLRHLVPLVYLGLLASFVWSGTVDFQIGVVILLAAAIALTWEGIRAKGVGSQEEECHEAGR